MAVNFHPLFIAVLPIAVTGNTVSVSPEIRLGKPHPSYVNKLRMQIPFVCCSNELLHALCDTVPTWWVIWQMMAQTSLGSDFDTLDGGMTPTKVGLAMKASLNKNWSAA